MNGYLLALAVIGVYLVILLAGRWSKLWKRIGVSLYGPIMFFRTKRGLETIARAGSRRRFWRAYGGLCIGVILLSMVLIVLFLFWETYGVLTAPTSPDADGIRLGPLSIDTVVLGYYLVFGLVVSVLVHEFAHGALASAEKIRLDAVGLLLLIVPLGAFVELNDDDLKKAKRTSRLGVYATGPATNMFAAAICLAVLVWGLGPAIDPISPGALVTDIARDSPAEIFGLPAWSEITEVDGAPMDDSSEFYNFEFDEPGEPVWLTYLHKGDELHISVPAGVTITQVHPGPAYNDGLKPGMIIASLNGTVIRSESQFRSVTENSSYKEPIEITVLTYGYDPDRGIDWFLEDPTIAYINLTSKWLYYYKYYPSLNKQEYENISVMGVSTAPLGVTTEDINYLPRLVSHPFTGDDGDGRIVRSILRFIALPTLGYSPVVSPATDLYQPSGAFSSVPTDIFWVLVNAVYWLFWTNLLVGLANALPAIPFDGGYALRDLLKETAHRSGDRLTGFEKTIGRRPIADWQIDHLMWVVTALVLLVVIFLVTWPIIDPII